MIGGSIVTGIGGAVLAARGTTKVGAVLDNHKIEMSKIEEAEERAAINGEEYSEKDIRKEKMKVFANTCRGIGKCYGPAAGCILASVGLNIGAHVKSGKEIKTLATKLAGAETGLALFSNYRKNVIADQGIEKDRYYLKNAAEGKRPLITTEKEGKKEIIKKEDTDEDVIDMNIDLYNGFVFYYSRINYDGSVNPEWEDNADFLQSQLIAKQNFYNGVFKSRGIIFLDDILQTLGLPITQTSRNIGYVWEEGRTISFGIDKDEYELFREGKTDGFFMVFNVNGAPDKNGRFKAEIITNRLEKDE